MVRLKRKKHKKSHSSKGPETANSCHGVESSKVFFFKTFLDFYSNHIIRLRYNLSFIFMQDTPSHASPNVGPTPLTSTNSPSMDPSIVNEPIEEMVVDIPINMDEEKNQEEYKGYMPEGHKVPDHAATKTIPEEPAQKNI